MGPIARNVVEVVALEYAAAPHAQHVEVRLLRAAQQRLKAGAGAGVVAALARTMALRNA